MPRLDSLKANFTHEQVRAVCSGYTGEVRFGFWNISLACFEGWLWLNGSTIGNASSGATQTGDTYRELFSHLWTVLDDTYGPLLTSAGAGTTRGASALADWEANKRLTLPNSAGKMPIFKAASGTASTLGETGGALTHTHNTKAHYHGMGTGADLKPTVPAGGTRFLVFNASGSYGTNTPYGTAGRVGDNDANAEIGMSGRIGLVTGGVDGNSAQATTDNSVAAPYIVYVGMIAI